MESTDLERIKEASALLADWAEECPYAGDPDEQRAEIIGAAEQIVQQNIRLAAQNLRLAQGLRTIRDTGSEFSASVAARALEEAGVPDPPEEDHL